APSPQRGEGVPPSSFRVPPSKSYALFLASLIARQTRSDVAGIAISRTPYTESASTIALATAGSAPTHPASPQPLTPSRLVLVGTGLLFIATAVKSLARGMA